MTLDELRAEVDRGAIDTVATRADRHAPQGRLKGKRLTARHFLAEVAEHGAEGCQLPARRGRRHGHRLWNEMFSGSAVTATSCCVPILDTLRPVPCRSAPSCCLAEVRLGGRLGCGRLPTPDPAGPARALAERGWSANAGTELEFSGPRHLRAGVAQGLPRDGAPGQPLQRRLLAARHRARGALMAAHPQQHGGGGMLCETPRASALRPARDQLPLRGRAANGDEHSIYKNASRRSQRSKAWRSRSWPSTTSARATRVTSTSRSPTSRVRLFHRERPLFESFLAGQLAALRELTLLLAPNVNSYKRFAAATFAPTTVAWGLDNRTCALRVVGHGPSLRFENRGGGAD